jgi:hypothetical protein
MSIQSIIDFIRNTKSDELSISNYFRGDINEYYRIGNDYINMLKNNFDNYRTCSDKSITIIYNNIWIYIKFDIYDNNNNDDEIYWTINMAENLNKLNDRKNIIINHF